MNTLIEAAQDVIACANPLGTTSNVRVPKYVMAALEQAIAQEQATHKPAGCRETWKCSHTWKCDNCGNGITLHEGQRYCHTKEMA